MSESHVTDGSGPGAVTLRVRAPEALSDFYEKLLGLAVEGVPDGSLRVSAPESGRSLLELEPAPGAPPSPSHSAGLFHLALRVPDRDALARIFLRLRNASGSRGEPVLLGASDHGVSRALYLADPDGHGLEIYHDRPRDAWPRESGRLAMWTRPLDLGALLEGVRTAGPLPPGTRVGHLHLRTADLAVSESFWTGAVGLDVTVRSYPGALFLAHGGYHHHLGLNVWGGPFSPAPREALGLARIEWYGVSAKGTGSRSLPTPDGPELRLVGA